eukprot:CAMPEP_0117536774 /NCGR_PEP_ID=MMETSP0784-20121206/41624_1 /TAXON_ID=39447 /ORGANISM="" /LENGTH=92 /DNA_ID=CAMNT_0005333343 /DNA_START=205 /DNA_END=483 /DNA_ORIENTATION=+
MGTSALPMVVNARLSENGTHANRTNHLQQSKELVPVHADPFVAVEADRVLMGLNFDALDRHIKWLVATQLDSYALDGVGRLLRTMVHCALDL